MKKYSRHFLALSLLVPVVASPANVLADNSVQATVSEVVESKSSNVSDKSSFLTVKDIVDQDYIEKYAGKFDSYEEVRNSAGFSSEGTVDLNSSEAQQAIKVNNVDEYAALLFYINDQALQSQTVDVKDVSSATNQSITVNSTSTRVFETIIAEALTQTVRGYVTATVSGGKITNAVTSSELTGFHPMNTWTHSNERSYVNLNSDKTGGSAHIEGTLKLVVLIEGIGTISTKQHSKNFNFKL